MKTHVVIATTEGPAFVQRITAEDPGVQSVICLDGTAQVLPISAAYHAFVRRGSGVIGRDFGHDAYRVDVDARIDQGTSWQLPVYLAHALHAQGLLGDGRPRPGDRVLWATGEVDVDLAVRPVAGVAQKLAQAVAPVRALRVQGVDVQLLLPTDNVGESAGDAQALGGVSGITRLADVLPRPASAAPVSPAALGPHSTNMRSSRWRRWALVVVGVVLLLLAVNRVQQQLDPAPGPATDLDDFGSRGRDLKQPD